MRWGGAIGNSCSAILFLIFFVCRAHRNFWWPSNSNTLAHKHKTAFMVISVFIWETIHAMTTARTAALTISLTYHQNKIFAYSRKTLSLAKYFFLFIQVDLTSPLHLMTLVRMPQHRHSSKRQENWQEAFYNSYPDSVVFPWTAYRLLEVYIAPAPK